MAVRHLTPLAVFISSKPDEAKVRVDNLYVNVEPRGGATFRLSPLTPGEGNQIFSLGIAGFDWSELHRWRPSFESKVLKFLDHSQDSKSTQSVNFAQVKRPPPPPPKKKKKKKNNWN